MTNRANILARTSENLGHSTTDVAWTLYFQGRYSQAEPFAMLGLKIREEAQGEWRPELAEALDAVAVIEGTGDSREDVAGRSSRRRRDLRELHGPLASTGRMAEASALEARDRSLRSKAR